MLSKVAERLYWLGRYLERVENTARLVNVYGNLLLDLPRPARLVWESLLAINGVYLVAVTAAEWYTGRTIQDYFYLDGEMTWFKRTRIRRWPNPRASDSVVASARTDRPRTGGPGACWLSPWAVLQPRRRRRLLSSQPRS